MEIIKIKPNMVFLLETVTSLPEQQKESILKEWRKVFPNNLLLIAKQDTLKVLELPDDSN